VCVDPEGNGATMNEGEKGGLARLAGDKISSQFPTVEWGSRSCQKIRRTGLVRHLDLIMHRVCIIVVLLYILTIVNFITVIVNSALPVYLFQENKSFGSKKPFAFIL
jgi:hypothetical protein